jgi:hypothetical protein
VRRLHRLGDHGGQLGAQRVEVDLVAQVRGERRERLLRVVLAAVEAAVDESLHTASGRPEQRGDGERRARDGEV